MSPIISRLKEKEIAHYIIHTNQHYSKELDEIFFKQLQLPPPDFSLDVGSGTHGDQTGKMLQRTESIFLKKATSFVLVQGDTNTTLAGALSASKLNIPVGHVEAGLRSHDRKMPEEINRIITDHISDLCFVPTEEQYDILLNEGIDSSKIEVTGNTIVDAVYQNQKFLRYEILTEQNISSKRFILATIHRQENVEDKLRLKEIFDAIAEAGRKYDQDVIAPLHPRTIKMLKKYGITLKEPLRIVNPLGYFEFLTLLKETSLVITDSGGLQEEACILQTPCVTVRKNTERPETIKVGANILGGVKTNSILSAVEKMIYKEKKWRNPFGDGKSSEKILNRILKHISAF
jgi:UDP-N-acetylglucosamine 2-epimerase (non-hydrolysing)